MQHQSLFRQCRPMRGSVHGAGRVTRSGKGKTTSLKHSLNRRLHQALQLLAGRPELECHSLHFAK